MSSRSDRLLAKIIIGIGIGIGIGIATLTGYWPRLAGLFSLDAFGGGLVIQSMLVLWLHLHFGLSPTETARVFFCTGLLSATSFFFVAPLVRRLGPDAKPCCWAVQ
jgi:hypothetical protein